MRWPNPFNGMWPTWGPRNEWEEEYRRVDAEMHGGGLSGNDLRLVLAIFFVSILMLAVLLP